VKVYWQLYFYTMAASASELANGYDVGAFSFALLHFKVRCGSPGFRCF
jgi:hypothetical protein